MDDFLEDDELRAFRWAWGRANAIPMPWCIPAFGLLAALCVLLACTWLAVALAIEVFYNLHNVVTFIAFLIAIAPVAFVIYLIGR